ncbi:MAG: hypothetical protein ACAH65_01085, partial [Chloroflexota bacterium]
MNLRLQRGRRAAMAATILVALLAIVGPSPASAGTLSVDPKAGAPETGVTVTGSGWDPKLGTAAILWDGKDVGTAFIDDKGELAGSFKVPDDVAGAHDITVCAPDAATCLEQAFATFVLVVPEPSPTPTPPPNPTPTSAPAATPPPTKAPGGNPTPTPANTGPSVAPSA